MCHHHLYIVFGAGDNRTCPYTVTINVKEKAEGTYVYGFSAKKEPSTQRTLHAAVNTYKGANGELFLEDIVSNPNADVKENDASKFESNQFKNADNKSPSALKDINYSYSPVSSAEQVDDQTEGAPAKPPLCKGRGTALAVEGLLYRNIYIFTNPGEISVDFIVWNP